MIAKEKDLTDLKNKVIIFPTDTVYGVGCLFDDLESIRRIFLLKGRDFGKPMAILAANTDMLAPLVEMNAEFMALAKRHWPGALTLIARKKSVVSDLVSAGKNTVGVRIPNHPLALVQTCRHHRTEFLQNRQSQWMIGYSDANGIFSGADQIGNGAFFSGN